MTTAHSQGILRDWLVGEEEEGMEAGRSGGQCGALRRGEGPRARDAGGRCCPSGAGLHLHGISCPPCQQVLFTAPCEGRRYALLGRCLPPGRGTSVHLLVP